MRTGLGSPKAKRILFSLLFLDQNSDILINYKRIILIISPMPILWEALLESPE